MTDREENIRIGMVNFINTAPLYETWKKTVHQPRWRIVEANPAELNQKMAAATIDLGFISSHEFAVSPGKYRILPGLSISASGPVGSVYLCSDLPLAELDQRPVFFSPQSQTSNSLAKIVLEEFIGVRPRYAVSRMLDTGDKTEATLVAIGDRALRIKGSGRYRFVLDLSEIWKQYTGLPFVFALWVVRQEFYLRRPEVVAAIREELLRCAREGRENLAAISRLAAPRIPMAAEDCFLYLQGIEYDLNPEKIKALQLFYTYLINRGEGDSDALPLRFA